MGYKSNNKIIIIIDYPVQAVDFYPPVEVERIFRKGGEEEYYIRGKMG